MTFTFYLEMGDNFINMQFPNPDRFFLLWFFFYILMLILVEGVGLLDVMVLTTNVTALYF